MRLDQQEIIDVCEHCHEPFKVTRGSVFEGNEAIALYLAAMHGCTSKLVHMAVGIRQGYNGAVETSAICIKAHPTDDEIQMSVTNPKDSPWKTEAYLGRLLSRDEALANPLINSFFHIADHIVTEVPALRKYLAKESGGLNRSC